MQRWLDRLDDAPRAALPVAVGVVALVVRLWVLFDQRAANPLFTLAILDDRVYLDLAADFAEGAPARPWFLAPLYPWVLGTVARVAGVSMLTASLVNVVAGTLSAVLAALAVRDLCSQAAGWLAGSVVALAGTFVFHDVLPGQEPLLCLLHLAGVWAGARWLRDGSTPAAGAAGLLAGVASMGRATSLAIAAAVALLALLRVRPARRLLPGLAALALGLAVVLVPAAIRNGSVAGAASPFPWSGGVNLYVANGPDARAETAFVSRELGFSPADMEANARRVAEDAAGGPLTAAEVSSYWAQRTREESGSAGEMATHLLRKAALFWAASEYGSNHFVILERRFSPYLRIVPVSAWWLLALGVGGWWLVRRSAPALDVAALTILLAWAGLTIVYPVSRYRLPVVPLAALLAAAGAARALRGVPRRSLATAGALVLVVAVLALSHGFVRPPPAAVPSYTNMGTALLRDGRAREAEDVLRDGLGDRPEDGPARLALGRALAAQGRHAEALEEYGRAEQDTRTQWAAGVPAVLSLVETGQAERAEAVLRVLDPSRLPEPDLRAELLAWGAVAAAARGDAPLARERLAAARRLVPDHPAVAEAARRVAGP